MAAKRTPKHNPLFDRVRSYIRRYVVLDDETLDVVTVWTMGTWFFSPACPASPLTYPYMYITAPTGGGKTVLGVDVLGTITRNHEPVAGITGAGVFRLLGVIDEETNEVINNYPTMAIDEIDATFSGSKDEFLRQMLNIGYKYGTTVPRTIGKVTYRYPALCPKILMGIDNGHLPETVTNRSIRIDIRRYSQDELATLNVEPFYSFDVADEAAELSEQLSQFAKDHGMVLRDYRPQAIPGLAARQWEVGRTLVQIASAIGVEARLRDSLTNVFTRSPASDTRKAMYTAIFDLFTELDEDRLTTKQILSRLRQEGIPVPGDSGKGLASVLSDDGINPTMIRLRSGHPGITVKDETVNYVHRGYFRRMFDAMFVKHAMLAYDEDDD